MNHRTFDALSRRAATGLDRRALLGGLTGAALLTALPAPRARAHEVNCKDCSKACETRIENVVKKASEDVCLYFYLFGDPELGEECDNALVDCQQKAADVNCIFNLDNSKKHEQYLRCLKDWKADYNADGNPFKTFLKWILKKAKDKKKK